VKHLDVGHRGSPSAAWRSLIAEEDVAATGSHIRHAGAASTAEAAAKKDDGGVQCLAAVPPAIPTTSMKTKRLNAPVKMMCMETVNSAASPRGHWEE
jgi:hypothetical protein